MDIDSGEILRRWEGCKKMCGLDVLRGLVKVGWNVENAKGSESF